MTNIILGATIIVASFLAGLGALAGMFWLALGMIEMIGGM